jgi:hypothetical protein
LPIAKEYSSIKQSPKEKLQFSLKLILGFPIVGVIWTAIIYFLSDTSRLNFNIAVWIGGIGIFLGMLCLINESIFRLTSWLWHKLVFLIDTAITWLTMPIFYYLVFSPFALILRVLGKVNMKKMSPNKETYWHPIKQPESNERYLRQF